MESSTGGRPRKVLRIGQTDAYALAADLGGAHARIGIVRSGGLREEVTTVPFDLSHGPEACLDMLTDVFGGLTARATGTLAAVGLSLPGPSTARQSWVDSPSRMPGWHRYEIREKLEERFGVTASIGNDANMMAMAKHPSSAESDYSITVKAGTAIGAGIVAEAASSRGARRRRRHHPCPRPLRPVTSPARAATSAASRLWLRGRHCSESSTTAACRSIRPKTSSSS